MSYRKCHIVTNCNKKLQDSRSTWCFNIFASWHCRCHYHISSSNLSPSIIILLSLWRPSHLVSFGKWQHINIYGVTRSTSFPAGKSAANGKFPFLSSGTNNVITSYLKLHLRLNSGKWRSFIILEASCCTRGYRSPQISTVHGKKARRRCQYQPGFRFSWQIKTSPLTQADVSLALILGRLCPICFR